MTLAEFLALPAYPPNISGLDVRALQDKIRDVLRQRQDALDSIESMRDCMQEEADEAEKIAKAGFKANRNSSVAHHYDGVRGALRTQAHVADGILQRPEFQPPEKP